MVDWRAGKARTAKSKQWVLDNTRYWLAENGDCLQMWRIISADFAEWTFPEDFQEQWRAMRHDLLADKPAALLQLAILLEELQQEIDANPRVKSRKRRTP